MFEKRYHIKQHFSKSSLNSLPHYDYILSSIMIMLILALTAGRVTLVVDVLVNGVLAHEL